nr:putative oxidoreductase [Mycolicibacterium komanii]
MIRVLLVGAGAVVEEHYRALLRRLERSGTLRVAAVVEPNESRGQRIAAGFKQADYHPDLDAAFAIGSYDLAIITSPPGLHADHVCASVERGSHVLCEKPMATTVNDANRMTAAAKRADRLLCVAFPRRFYSSFADVAKLVSRGDLGEDLRFTYREGGTYGWPVATDAAFRREKSGGGALMDKGVHVLDLLSSIFGEPSVERAFDDSFVGGVETNSKLELAFPRARGTMHVSWEYPLNNGLQIQGSAGEVRLDLDEIRMYRRKTSQGWMLVPATTDWPADMKASGGERIRPVNYPFCFEIQLIAMLRCIAYGEVFPVTGDQAAGVQRAIEEAYERAEPLACEWLSEAEQAAARTRHWKGMRPA